MFSWRLPTILASSLVSSWIAFSPPAVAGRTLNVPDQYPTIQSAIDASQSGDTVLVADGKYWGNGNRDLAFNGRNITVTSANGPMKTFIDCGGSDARNHRAFQIIGGSSEAVIRGFTIKNGYEAYGGGIILYQVGASVENCVIKNCVGAVGGGAIYVRSSSPGANPGGDRIAVSHCALSGNTAEFGGGLYLYNENPSTSISVESCSVSGNAASVNGGGFANYNTGVIALDNCLITGNFGNDGGGANNYNAGGSYLIASCTVTGNSAGNGGGIENGGYGGSVNLTGDIVYANGDGEVIGGGSVTYCDVQGGYPGIGNLAIDPLFVNAPQGDYHLKPGSACIGQGLHAAAPNTDLDGMTRPNPPSLGAYELATTTGSVPVPAWAERYGGSSTTRDIPAKIAVDRSGDVVVAGTTYHTTPGSHEVWSRVAKYDAAGNRLWIRRNKALGDGNSGTRALALDGAGNIYVTGAYYTTKAGGVGQDIVTLKYAPDGTELWRAHFDGSASGDDIPAAISVDGAGDVYVSGTSAGTGSGTDIYVLKYDAGGAKLWGRRYNGPANGNDTAFAQAVGEDGSVYVAGSLGNATGSDFTLLKFDADGRYIWDRALGGIGGGINAGKFVAFDSAGHIVVAAESAQGMATLEFDQDGNRLWRKFFAEGTDPADMAIDPSDNVIVTTTNNDGGATIKYSATGNEIWMNHDAVGVTGRGTPRLGVDDAGNVYLSNSIQPGIAGRASDFLTLKYNADGSLAWRADYGSRDESDALALAVDSAGDAYVTGASTSHGSFGFLTIKYNP